MEFRFKTKPYKHQLDALKTSCEKDEYALLMDMGTGKSKVLIDTIAYLYDAGKINSAFILAPKGVYKNWVCLLYTSPSPRDNTTSRMPSSA